MSAVSPQKSLVVGVYGLANQESLGRHLSGVVQYAREHPNIALHEFYDVAPSDVDEQAAPPWRGDVDGILLAVGAGPGVVDWVRSGGVPAFNMVADIVDPRLPTIYIQPASIAKLAVDHLRACGCRRYLHVGSGSSMGSALRVKAFEEAVAATGCPFALVKTTKKHDEFNPAPEDAECREALDQALTSTPGPVGVLALNDVIARAVLARAEALGLEVPEQVAVVGVDDSFTAISQLPMLTSIRTPGKTVGYRAMERLAKMIRGGRRPRKPIEVPATELIVRESTGGVSHQMSDMTRAMELIYSRADSGISIEDILETLSISRRTLNVNFKQLFGRSPGEEIQRLRIAYATDLVVHTKFSIDHMAARLGFAEPTSFTKFFRKHTGASPTAYRKQQAER
jgi:LacI family transcriptional regulator